MSALKPENCLESCLVVPIRRFIQLRQLSGTDYHTQAQLLVYFDRFLVAQKVTGSQLTRQLVEAYEKTLSRLAPRGRANRMCVVRLFTSTVPTNPGSGFAGSRRQRMMNSHI